MVECGHGIWSNDPELLEKAQILDETRQRLAAEGRMPEPPDDVPNLRGSEVIDKAVVVYAKASDSRSD